jgi:hypothetical protein
VSASRRPESRRERRRRRRKAKRRLNQRKGRRAPARVSARRRACMPLRPLASNPHTPPAFHRAKAVASLEESKALLPACRRQGHVSGRRRSGAPVSSMPVAVCASRTVSHARAARAFATLCEHPPCSAGRTCQPAACFSVRARPPWPGIRGSTTSTSEQGRGATSRRGGAAAYSHHAAGGLQLGLQSWRDTARQGLAHARACVRRRAVVGVV